MDLYVFRLVGQFMHDIGKREGRPRETPPAATDGWDQLRWWGAAIASLVWLAVYVHGTSSRGDDLFGFGFMLGLGWLIASLGLAGFWLVVAVVAVRAWVNRNTARARRTTAFLVPFASVVAVAILLSAYDVPLRTRFGLSEGSLNRLADEYEQTGGANASHWAGLYHVLWIRRWENCTVVVTGSFFLDESGFVRCSGPPPPDSWSIRTEHLKGDWWTFDSRD